PAGLYYPGDSGFPTEAGQNPVWTNIGPRAGLSWDPTGGGRTSVRASYGRSFDFVNGQFHLNTSNAPPWGDEIRVNNPPGGLDNPFVGATQPNIFPTPTASPDVVFTTFGPYLSLNYDMKTPYVDLWNVTVERQLSASWVVSAGYVGSHTANILESTPLNNANPAVTVARDVNGNVLPNGTCNPAAAAARRTWARATTIRTTLISTTGTASPIGGMCSRSLPARKRRSSRDAPPARWRPAGACSAACVHCRLRS